MESIPCIRSYKKPKSTQFEGSSAYHACTLNVKKENQLVFYNKREGKGNSIR